MTEIEIKIDGDVSDADALHVAKQITATGARYRVTGPLAEALTRMNAAAYERGRRDMRERAAGVAENCIWASTVRLHATKKEVSARSCYEVAAAIRALPTGGENG